MATLEAHERFKEDLEEHATWLDKYIAMWNATMYDDQLAPALQNTLVQLLDDWLGVTGYEGIPAEDLLSEINDALEQLGDA